MRVLWLVLLTGACGSPAPPPETAPAPSDGCGEISNVPSDTLTNADICRVVKAAYGRVNECYDQTLVGARREAGAVEVAWTVKADGTVMAAEIVHYTYDDEQRLGRCLVGVVETLRFPTGKIETPTRWTFDFGS